MIVWILTRSRLGTLYNATRGRPNQDEVKKWIEANYVQVHDQLVAIGSGSTRAGDRYLKINRSLEP